MIEAGSLSSSIKLQGIVSMPILMSKACQKKKNNTLKTLHCNNFI